MKSIYPIAVVLFILGNACTQWIESSPENVINQTSFGILISDASRINDVRHYVDRGIVEFKVIGSHLNEFKEFDKSALNNGWCIAKKDEGRLYISQHESSHSVETISVTWDREKQLMLIVIRFE